MCFSMYNGRWFDTPAWLNQVVDLAYELDQTYPNERLISVGQSPAWIVDSVGYIREQQGRENNTMIVPFSGKFMGRDRGETAENFRITFLPSFRPMVEQPWYMPRLLKIWPRERAVSDYFNHLSRLNVAPEDVIATAEGGRKSIFIDMGETFEGIASFATLYLQNADQNGVLDDTKNSAEFYLYDIHNSLPEKTVRLNDNAAKSYDLPVSVRPISSTERFIFGLIACSNTLDQRTSRLAEYYDLSEPTPSIKRADNAPMVEDARRRLRDEIMLREHPKATANFSSPQP